MPLSILALIIIGGLITVIIAIIIAFIGYKLSYSKLKQLDTIQSWMNKNQYKPSWPQVPKLENIEEAITRLTSSQKTQLTSYLKFLYPELDVTKYQLKDLYSLYSSFTIYYNKDTQQSPNWGAVWTPGWIPGPDSPTVTQDPINSCYQFFPWIGTQQFCEPGFTDKAVSMPITPLGYFSEYNHLYNELADPNNPMSIGQTTIPLLPTFENGGGNGGKAAPMGQWVTHYVEKIDNKEIIKQRSIYDPKTLALATSMGMWEPFSGRGVSFLQGGTLHRMWWYPNGPPGQLKDPYRNRSLYPIDAYSLDAPGCDFGMISSKGNKITLDACIKNVDALMEYLEMKGDIPTISWKPPSSAIASRFNAPGRVWSGYKKPSSSKGYYFTEFMRTDMGTNFAFTGNWFNIFEGAGLFYKYTHTLISPNKSGAIFKLMKELYTTNEPLLRIILGADYVKGKNPNKHMPTAYGGSVDKQQDYIKNNNGDLYSNMVGVTQGMCMGSSLPGKTGKVILDATDSNSGAQLFWEAWHPNGKEDPDAMIYMGLLWFLCNSPVHPPFNNTSIVSIFGAAQGYPKTTWDFFSFWAQTKKYNLSDPNDLRKAFQIFYYTCIMGSGLSSVENYMINTWQNSTIFDLLMFGIGNYLDYDLIQLTIDVSENDMWTRESLAMALPPDFKAIAKKQLELPGPHGGSFLIFCEQFGTHYTNYNPKFVNRTDKTTENPMPFYRNPENDETKWLSPYGIPLGATAGVNKGLVVTGEKNLPYGPPNAGKFSNNSDFNTTLFTYYSTNGILTLRDPMNLDNENTDPVGTTTKISDFITQIYGRSLADTAKVQLDPHTGIGTVNNKDFPTTSPNNKRDGQRCFGDFCAFYADDTQTKAWGRQATGYGF